MPRVNFFFSLLGTPKGKEIPLKGMSGLQVAKIDLQSIKPDDEDEMDDNLEHGRVHVDVDCETPNNPLQLEHVGVTNRSRECTSNSSLNCRVNKEARIIQMGDAMKGWMEASKAKAETCKARIEALLAKAERYKSGTSSEATGIGDYSITQCMSILQIIEGLDNDKYLKAVEKFTSPEWREIFMNMPDERRMAWLDRL